MLFKGVAENVVKPVIVFQRLYLRYRSESLECFVVQLVDEGEMRIRYNHVRQLLDISKTMGNSI